MSIVRVYLHNEYTHLELEDVYDLDHDQADRLFNLLYEVPLDVNLETGEIQWAGEEKA